MSENKVRSPKASERQKEELLKYFEDNPQALRILNGSDNRTKQKIWIELTHKLNTLDGALKTTNKWSKYWNDIILYTKTRARTFISGELRCDRPPSDIEKRLLTLIGHLALLKTWQRLWKNGLAKQAEELTSDNAMEASFVETADVQSEHSSVDDTGGNDYETMLIVSAEATDNDRTGTTIHNVDVTGRVNAMRDSKEGVINKREESCDANENVGRGAGLKEESFVEELVDNVRTIGNNFNSIGLALHNIASLLERYTNSS